ncbi:helix-turn-helix transcriptional regulator [Flavobacterium sp. ENC]|uniref:helix-turn-helix domain-containing protein n=1 Tax=Flavobacterium sp. ENC TaxID=2897330 RepID=UPI001E359981|nr:helix-turn-helix transcriptional regulator [Flavobacterium sp. ENC]MCD0465436.1 helix-turn-helix domain-containing protein [Flavobacterium sp. ENC]
MVNIDDFVKRLEVILDYYGLNASAFADKIGVQRSSMSHLLSGRNKPSLDFVLKILDVFPDVDLYWILNGKGSFPKKEDEIKENRTDASSEIEKANPPIPLAGNFDTADLFSGFNPDEEVGEEKRNLFETKNSNVSPMEGEIEKIVFFYKNGTFKVYIP